MSFETSWAEAEMIVFNAICKATGTTEGKQAFRGFVPAMVNVWGLYTGGQGGNEQTGWSPDIVSVHFGAKIEAVFTQRENLLMFTMQVIKALPIANVGKVQCFRIRQGGYSEPVPDLIPLANSDQKATVWTISLGCELVFNTGGRV